MATTLLGERFPLPAWLGTIVSFAGIGLIALGEGHGLHVGVGALLVLGAAVCASTATVVQKPLFASHRPLVVSAVNMVIGALVLAPALPSGLGQIGSAPAGARFAVLYLGVVPSLIAYATWSMVLARLPAARAARTSCTASRRSLHCSAFFGWAKFPRRSAFSAASWRSAAFLGSFFSDVFTTSSGWTLIIVGNLIGFVFAVVVLATTVVAFPILLDRDIGAYDAMHTSVRAVLANPVPMAVWGLIVAALLVVGSIPLFAGLAVVIPILGHATWHLYRRVIEPPAGARRN